MPAPRQQYELGDFGMGGMHFRQGGYVTPSTIFNASLFAERALTGSPARTCRKSRRAGSTTRRWTVNQAERKFDFAMLLPPFSGVGLKACAQDGADTTDRLFLLNGFMRVDADYSTKP